MRALQSQLKTTNQPILYRVVFKSVTVKSLIAFLFLFFFLQPAMPAFAADEGAAQSTDEVVTAIESTTEAAMESAPAIE